jgi:hypothetical protein
LSDLNVIPILICNKNQDNLFWGNAVYPYIQPIKIAVSMTLTSTLVLVDSLREQIPNGFWATTVIALIRQDNTSSSFLIGFQRVEGTVIGAVVAFTLYQLLRCTPEAAGDNTALCGFFYTTPILSAWIALCAFFREDPRHGYAAIVAGFTPILLLLGPSLASPLNAWQRIETTIIGICVYLVIDNIFFPVRSDIILRENLVKSVDLTANIISAILNGVDDLKNQKVRCVSRESISDLSNLLAIQKGQLFLAAHEPQLQFTSPFPMVQFEKFHGALKDVLRSVEKLVVSLIACHQTLDLKRKNIDSEILGLSNLLELLSGLLKESDVGIKEAVLEVQALYRSLKINNFTNNNYFRKRTISSTKNVDLQDEEMPTPISRSPRGANYRLSIHSITFSGLIALPKIARRLSDNFDEYFRDVYTKNGEILNYDMNLILEIQSLSFGLFHLIPKLKSLGHALYALCVADGYCKKSSTA